MPRSPPAHWIRKRLAQPCRSSSIRTLIMRGRFSVRSWIRALPSHGFTSCTFILFELNLLKSQYFLKGSFPAVSEQNLCWFCAYLPVKSCAKCHRILSQRISGNLLKQRISMDYGDPGKTRTSDTQFRKPVSYTHLLQTEVKQFLHTGGPIPSALFAPDDGPLSLPNSETHHLSIGVYSGGSPCV